MAETESKNLKRVRVDSDDSLESQTESLPDSPEAKRLRVDLLDILDDTDNAGDRDVDLASVMKSFEEEITSSLPLPPVPGSSEQSGVRPLDLGYLLEASDDELGLPPTTSGSEGVVRGPFEAEGFGHMWFEDEIPSYDALEFGIREVKDNEDEAFVFDGLFDYSDMGCGPSDFSDVAWRPETLPAL